MSYTYIEAPNYTPLPANQQSIFLGGGITGCEDWQAYVTERLRGFGDITIVNPRRADFDMSAGDDESRKQIAWEHHYLDKCDQVLFWFSDATIQPIVLFEFGARLRDAKWRPYEKQQSIFVGVHALYKRKFDVLEQAHLEGFRGEIFNNLSDLAQDVLNYNRTVKLYA
jgi:hypothetical protein